MPSHMGLTAVNFINNIKRKNNNNKKIKYDKKDLQTNDSRLFRN